MASNSPAIKASPGTQTEQPEQTEAEIEILRQLEQQRRARYRLDDNGGDGRPRVDKLRGDDPLLEAFKGGKR